MQNNPNSEAASLGEQAAVGAKKAVAVSLIKGATASQLDAIAQKTYAKLDTERVSKSTEKAHGN